MKEVIFKHKLKYEYLFTLFLIFYSCVFTFNMFVYMKIMISVFLFKDKLFVRYLKNILHFCSLFSKLSFSISCFPKLLFFLLFFIHLWIPSCYFFLASFWIALFYDSYYYHCNKITHSFISSSPCPYSY